MAGMLQISIKITPEVNDLVMVATLANQLTELAARADPVQARVIRKELGYRLKRIKKVCADEAP